MAKADLSNVKTAARRRTKYARLGRQESTRPDGRVTQHELAIRALVAADDRIQRNGFNLAVEQLWNRLQDQIDDDEPVPAIEFRPDAFLVNERDQYLEIFEVEDWGPIRANKRIKMGLFWFYWDSEDRHEWLPRLWLVNRYGMVTTELPMSVLYLEYLTETVAAGDAPTSGHPSGDSPNV